MNHCLKRFLGTFISIMGVVPLSSAINISFTTKARAAQEVAPDSGSGGGGSSGDSATDYCGGSGTTTTCSTMQYDGDTIRTNVTVTSCKYMNETWYVGWNASTSNPVWDDYSIGEFYLHGTISGVAFDAPGRIYHTDTGAVASAVMANCIQAATPTNMIYYGTGTTGFAPGCIYDNAHNLLYANNTTFFEEIGCCNMSGGGGSGGGGSGGCNCYYTDAGSIIDLPNGNSYNTIPLSPEVRCYKFNKCDNKYYQSASNPTGYFCIKMLPGTVPGINTEAATCTFPDGLGLAMQHRFLNAGHDRYCSSSSGCTTLGTYTTPQFFNPGDNKCTVCPTANASSLTNESGTINGYGVSSNGGVGASSCSAYYTFNNTEGQGQVNCNSYK